MAEPLVIQFAADTTRAQSAMASLAAQVVGNMTQIGVAMAGGAANANGFGAALEGMKANAVRAATAVGADVKAIAGAARPGWFGRLLSTLRDNLRKGA